MVKKSRPEAPQPAQLTADQMRRAIPKLRRRIEEFEAFDPNMIQHRSEPLPKSLEQKADSTLVEILGSDTLDYQRFHIGSLDRAAILYGGTPLSDVRKGFARGKADAISKLRTLIDLFEERLAEGSESPEERARRGFEGLQLHPEVLRAVEKLYLDGHYANAVEDACKVLDLLVKMRSGRIDIAGTELMQAVFSPKSPVLRFSDLSTESERGEQQGMMFLYAGVMLAFRNPRAHGLLTDDPEEALEVISFVSFLANVLDKAVK